jgi:hypothetical protein
VALSLKIGNPNAIAKIQSGAVTTSQFSGSGSIAASISAVSTQSTCLIAIIGGASGSGSPVASGFPFGWSKISGVGTTGADYEAWIYPNNPGGISSVTCQVTESPSVAATWCAHLSEWSNVAYATPLEANGTASSSSGTTLAVATSGNVLTTGDVAIAGWMQFHIALATTFTTPGGFTRLADNSGAGGVVGSLDIEYVLNPATGAPIGCTLTSNQTTVNSAGSIFALKHSAAQTDQTNYLKYGTMTQKLNTLDFALIDPAVVPDPGDAVALTTPTWNGTVVSVTKADIVDIKSGHKLVTVAATNTTVGAGGGAPFNLSDVPNGTTLRAYSRLMVRITNNANGTAQTYGSLYMYDTGLLPGMAVTITSANLGLSAVSYTITNVTETWIGLQVPALFVEFGDPYPTLAKLVQAIVPLNSLSGTTPQTQFYSGVGAPNNANGNNGDFYFRTDTPATTNQRLYNRQAGTWTGIL